MRLARYAAVPVWVCMATLGPAIASQDRDQPSAAPANAATARLLRQEVAEEFRDRRQWTVADYLAREPLIQRAVQHNRGIEPRWAAAVCRSYADAIAPARPKSALGWFDQAVAIARDSDLPLQAAQHLLGKCQVLTGLSRYADVLGALRVADRMLEGLPADDIPAQRGRVGIAMQQGIALLGTGDIDSALARLDLARERVSRIHGVTQSEQAGLAQVSINRGIVLARAGRFGEALREYDSAHGSMASIDDPVIKANIDSNIANINSTIGRLDAAREHYEKVGATYRTAGRALLYARSRTNLALVCMRLGDDSGAAEALEEAIPIFATAGDDARRADAQLLHASCLARLGRRESALLALDAARTVFERHGLPQALGQLELGVAATMLAGQDGEAAAAALHRAEEQLRAAGSLTEFALLHVLRGEAWRVRGDDRQALEEYARAARRVAATTVQVQVVGDDASRSLREQFAEVAPRAAELAQRVRSDRSLALAQAYAVTQALHGLGATDMLARRVLPENGTVSDDLRNALEAAELELDAAQRAQIEVASRPATTTAELRGRAQARRLAQDRLRKASLELERLRERERLALGFLSLAEPRPTTLERVQQELDETTALAEFVVGPSSAHVFVVGKTHRALLQLDATAAGTAVKELAELLQDGHTPSGTELRRCGRLVLDPILAQLPAGITTILFAPRGDYCRVPLELLLTGSANDDRRSWPHLLQRFAVAYVPSGTAFVAMRKRPVEQARPSSLSFLGLGQPVANGRIELQQSSREVLAIARRFTSDETELATLRSGDEQDRLAGERFAVLLREAATEAALRATRNRPVDYVHIACHAEVDTTAPRLSRLVLTPSTDPSTAGRGAHDGMLYLSELRDLELRCRLLVLSSCSSAIGPLSRVDGMLGLASAGLAGGAQSVLSTLWPVSDRATADFMDLFYDELSGASNGNPSAALRAARQRAIRDGQPIAAWSAFILFDAAASH